MELNYLIEKLDKVNVIGEVNKDISMICYNSREAKQGGLFVAIDGFKVDGHAYISNAVENGCHAVVVEKDIEVMDGVTIIQVPSSRKALAILTGEFYENLSKQFSICGITGTKGKTSTAHLIKAILEADRRQTTYLGTTTDFSQYGVSKNTPTTPEIVEIHKIMKQIYPDTKELVMEVTSHALALNRVYGLDFDVSVFTNLAPDHLDFHETIENYFEEKKKLFLQTKGLAVINKDNLYGKHLIEFCKERGLRVSSYGISEKADFCAKEIKSDKEGSSFIMETPKGSIDIQLSLLGQFNISNALAAAAVGLEKGISLELVKKGLESVHTINGRVERFRDSRGFDVFIDFAHTPDSLEKIILASKEAGYQRTTVVFGLGGERYRAKRSVMGKIAGELADYTILTEDNSRSESASSIISDIEEGIQSVDGKYIIIEDREKAIQWAITNGISGEAILILGKGHEDYQLKNGKKIPFNEHEIIRKYIQ